MTSSTLGSRLRRAAVLTLFFGWFTSLPTIAPAQPISDQRYPPSGVVNSDGGGSENTISSNEPSGSCETCCSGQGECDGNCNQYFDDECKHDYPAWVGAEWIHWRLDGSRLPPLVTDAPIGTAPASVARLGDPSTRILSGDQEVNGDWRNGFRVFGGVWLDCCRTWGLGVDYFDVGDDDYGFTSENDPNRVVGRPFFNTVLGVNDVQLVSVPGQLEGNVRVESSDSFRGAGLTLNRRLWQCCDACSGDSHELNILGGYRFYEYDTNLSITENLLVLPGTQTPLVPGTTFFVQDRFHTHNVFNGGEIGLQAFSRHSCWSADGTAKIAMGEQHRTVRVGGETNIDVPGGGTSSDAGGLLTSGVTNIGRYEDSDFIVIPEFRLGIGRQLTNCCSIRAGYNVIIWGDVARAASHLPPGLQVDPRNVPPVQAGGGPEPAFPGIRGSQLLAQGWDFTVMFAF